MPLLENAKLLVEEATHIDKEGLSLQELLELLNLLTDTTYRVRQAFNARTPIHKLPPELLVRIFSLVQHTPLFIDHVVEQVCGPHHFRIASVLLPISLVCHHWRDVVLNAPLLWSTISCAHPRWGPFPSPTPMKHFSRLPCAHSDSPLSVYGEAPGRDDYKADVFLRAHAHRVRELFVSVHNLHLPHGDERIIPPLLSFPAKKLERLIMKGVGSRLPAFRWQDRSLFGGRNLHLHSLFLTDVQFLPTNIISTTLTRLVLIYTHTQDRDAWGLPAPNLLRFLKGTPALQEAYLEGLVKRSHDGTTLPSAPVPLKRMRKLLVASGKGAATILTHLELPPDCLLRTKVDVLSHDEIRFLVTAFQETFRWQQTKLHCVWAGETNTYANRGNPGHISLQAMRPSGGCLRVDLSSKQSDTWGEADAGVRSLLACLPFAAAEEVWLSGNNAWRILRHGSKPLTRAKTLHLLRIESFAPSSVGILWPNSGDDHQDRSTGALENLHICMPEGNGLESLVELLIARAEVGQLLSNLYVSVRSPDSLPAATVYEEIQNATEPFVEDGEVGEDLYDAYSWWSILPKECTAEAETHSLWPVWAEGVTPGNYSGGSLSQLSGRVDVAFGPSRSSSTGEPDPIDGVDDIDDMDPFGLFD
ncbi:hypothetical protein BD311DRAFT_496619 [Dichomitus squalens]|uniref:F-box domain-containing protein n=1 Tax=Dichomitus squalens TaxID=114155 RepID=A0A4Q9ME36_9APHY|nr:hypothetical protein BD311DRAFT_496619 [Dichomitus squalens]